MKKFISFLLVLLLVLPLSVFTVSAQTSDWNYLAAKYSTKTKAIIAPKGNDYKIKDDYFIFNKCGNGEIKVTTPNYDSFAGAFGVSAIASKKTVSLEGLSVVITPDDFDFTQDRHGRSNQISLIWSDKPVTEIAGGTNGNFTTGIYDSAQLACGGLRNLVPIDAKGLCVTLSSADAENEGTKTATTVRIVYYDGSYTDENGNIGYSWVFTRNPADGITPLVEPGIKTTPYENIDITYGLIINIKPDPELGYVVNINGKDYIGENAGYRSGDISEIDLSALKDISEGYITVGAVSNDDQYMTDHSCNYTISYINGERPLTLWGNTFVPHEHSYVESSTEQPTCTKDGKIIYACECGASYSEALPKTGHTEGERKEDGSGRTDVYCSVCGELMYTESGFDSCKPFVDVKKNHWFYDSVNYVVSKGYMYGMKDDEFSPNTDLTREQFVTILANIAGIDKEEYKNEQLMSDVKPNHWFAGSVNWAVKEGYVAGISEGVFGVGKPIQRAALARLLYLYAEHNGKQTEKKADLSVYTDYSKVQDWMADGLGWAVEYGIITSIKDDALTLAPTSTATRAQCARMLTVYDSVPDNEVISEPEPEPEPEPDPIPTPEPKAIEVDEEALKELLVQMGNKNLLGDYCLKMMNTSVVYDEERDELYALWGIKARYYFGSERVELLGAGNVRPLLEVNGDIELLLPYQEIKGYAKMTASGIFDAPEEYKSMCDEFYADLIYILDLLGVLK